MRRRGLTACLLMVCACRQPTAAPPELALVAAPPPLVAGDASAPPSALGDLAGVWRLLFSLSSESSCSQSFATSSRAGEYTLQVDASGDAILQLDLRTNETFGPSFGRYQAGDHGFDHRSERFRYRWRASARLQRSVLYLAIRAQDGECSSLYPDGRIARSIACPMPDSKELECTQGPVSVGRGEEDAGVEEVFGLRCPWLAMPYGVSYSGVEKAPLTKAPGLSLKVTDFDSWPQVILRHATED